MLYAAIPTTYAGTRYRSRLEARYACLFDLCGLSYEYEALDLAGPKRAYIADFLVDIPAGLTLLWECKPAITRQDFKPAERRITRSGWRGPAVVSGARLVLGPDDRADLSLVGSLAAEHGSWSLVGRERWPRAWGEYPFEDVLRRWREAGNRVQWSP